MKFVIVGNEEECLGFSLAGVEGVMVEEESAFIEQMQQLFSDREVGGHCGGGQILFSLFGTFL